MAQILYSSFNDGELSPLLEGRVDMEQYPKGGRTMLNMLPTVQGPAQRRGGTRLISSTVGSPGFPSLLVRFSRSQTESYILEFYASSLRFWFNGALVLNGASPYVISTPFVQGDLYNSDGTVALVAAESSDVIYFSNGNHQPQTLSFFSATNWVFAPFVNADGPWDDTNPNLALTVYATGSVTIGSTVTLTASAALFQSGHVGSLFRLHQQDLTTIKPWQPGEQTPNIAVGVQRRSGFCTYQCTNASAGTAPSGGTTLLFVQTGGSTLIHTLGKAWDGDQTTTITPIGSGTYYSTGMQWLYEDCGYGVVQITAVTNSTTATATVIRQLPAAVIGSTGASNIWEMGAWNGVDGYPSQVCFFRQRLTFANKQRVWMSVVGDYANFADMNFGEIVPDSAVTLQVQSDQVNNIVYLSPADTLIVGTTGGEFIIQQQSNSDPFGPENCTVTQQSAFGGRSVIPTRVQQYTLFCIKNGRSIREASYSFTAGPNGQNVSNDLTVLSEHITIGGIIGSAWAKNPVQVIWYVLGNGNLIAFTYNPEQEVKAWHRHDLGGGAQVVNLAVVPNGTGDWDDVYAVVLRTIPHGDGTSSTNYQIERIEQPFLNLPGQSQQTAFYVDSGLTLINSINSILQITGAYTVQGTTGVIFQAFSAVWASTDVGRFIHYDWQSTTVGTDGLTYPLAAKGIAQITSFQSSTVVFCTIISPFPASLAVLGAIPANGWRMTVTTISSLAAAWQGNTVSVFADGAALSDQFIAYGQTSMTIEVPSSYVTIGIKSPSVYQTMKPEGGDPTGSNMMDKKKVVRVKVRLLNSFGPQMGKNISLLQAVELRKPNVADDNPAPIFTGDTERTEFNGDWDEEGRIMVTQQQPLPLTICAIVASIDVKPAS